jgi:hypothetical protein
MLALTDPPDLDGREIKIEAIRQLDEPDNEYTHELVYSAEGAVGRARISADGAASIGESNRGPRVVREREIWCVLFRDQLRCAPADRAATSVDEALVELRRRDMIDTMYEVIVMDGRNR